FLNKQSYIHTYFTYTTLFRSLRNSLVTKRTEVVQAATDSCLKPGRYELGSLESRAAARALLDAKLERIRFILTCKKEPLNLENSTCMRVFWRENILFEMVELDGSDKDLTEEELEKFIAAFRFKRTVSATPPRCQEGGKHLW